MFYPLLQPNRRDRENVCLVAAGRVQGGHLLSPPPGQVSRALRGGQGEGVRRGENGRSPPAAATLCCVVLLCCDAVLKGRREGRLLKLTGRGDWDGRAHGLATRGLLPYRISGDAADGLTSSLHTFEGRVPVIHHCPCTRPSRVGWPGAARRRRACGRLWGRGRVPTKCRQCRGCRLLHCGAVTLILLDLWIATDYGN